MKLYPLVQSFFVTAAIATSILASTPEAKPWKGAEVISRQTFKYGAFEARIRAAKGGGVITPFFLWKDGSELSGSEWQEQDFELFGRDGSFQSQLMTPGKVAGEQRTEHVVMHYPTTPAYNRYNTYRMEWTPDSLCFYYNGQLIRKETDRTEYSKLLDPARAEAMQLRLSNWAGDFAWSGAFDQNAIPADVFVNWVQTYSYTPGRGPGGTNFTPLWRDDFESWNDSRWWKANWTFEFAVNDYIPENAAVRSGALNIALTHFSQQGTFRAVPADDGLTPPLVELPKVDSTPFAVPGTINLIRYLGSNETTPGNYGNTTCLSHSPDVDFGETNEGVGGACHLSWIDAGEWLEYRIDVAATGLYDIALTQGSMYDRQFQLSVDGAVVVYTTVPATGGYTTWKESVTKKVSLTAGVHVLRVAFPDGYLNVKGLEIRANNPFTPVPGRVFSTDYSAFYDLTSINHGGACGDDALDKEITTDVGGGCAISFTEPTEWVDYPVELAEDGWYRFNLRLASAYAGLSVRVLVDGVDMTGSVMSPAAGWAAYEDVPTAAFPMTAGRHTVRVEFVTGYVNFHYFDVIRSDIAPPLPVTGLTATAGDAVVDLTWAASVGASAYKVVRGTDTIASVTATSYRDESVINGTEYTYVIVSANSAGNGGASSAVSVRPMAPEPPSAPTGLAALAGNSVVSLAWSPVDAVTAYKVYRSVDGTNFTSLATVVDAQYSDASVTNGTVYTYRVTALRGSLESVPSSSVDAAPRGEAPLQVTGLVATPADAKVTLVWTAPAGAETYTIYRGVDGATAVVLTVVSSASYDDVTVANGSTYAYTVVASNTWGDAPMSAQVTATPLAYPDVPSALVATTADSRVDLVWLGGANTESFKVYRATASGANELIATVATPSYSDLAVVNGTTYSYSVTAVNSTLESAPSQLVTARPVGAVPEQVTGLIATANDATVALTWNNSVGASSYKVMRSVGTGVATLVGTSLSASFTDATVSNGTVYSYSVVASNEWGDAVASSIVTATPDFAVPGVPSSLSALAGNGRVTLAWTAGANNASFKIYRATAGGAAILLATSSQAAYVDVTVANGTTYTYTVAGVNGTKESDVSNAAIAEPRGAAPSQVTGLVATAGNATVALSWSASPLATVYKVVRGTDTVARIASASYTDNAVVNGTTYSYAVVASNIWGNAPVSVSVSAKPTAPTAGIKAQYKAGMVGATTNGIRPLLQIVNTGSAPVALSKVTVRYWFTNNGTQSVSYWCDWAQIGSANLTGTFKTVSPARTKADRYLEIGFKTSAGNLSAGGSTGEIQSRFSKSDWTNFTQTDDASYDPTKATSYADWNKVTVYYEGALVWGVEP